MSNKHKYFTASALILAALAAVMFASTHKPIDRSSRSDNPTLGRHVNPTVPSANAPATAASPTQDGTGTFNTTPRTSPPQGNAVAVIQQLKPLAEAGDAQAALLLYLKLYSCKDVLNTARDERAIAAHEETGATKNPMEDRLSASNECADTEPEIRQRGKWLELAATKGLVEAQLLYAMDSSAVLGNGSDMIRDPAAVQRYKERASGYLLDAARKGNIDAMLRVGAGYENGILFKKDIVRSYAYYSAIQYARPSPIMSQLVSSMSREMTPQQIVQGDALAKAITRDVARK